MTALKGWPRQAPPSKWLAFDRSASQARPFPRRRLGNLRKAHVDEQPAFLRTGFNQSNANAPPRIMRSQLEPIDFVPAAYSLSVPVCRLDPLSPNGSGFHRYAGVYAGEAGALWCHRATRVAAKPWKYLLISHDQVTEDKGLADFLRFEQAAT